MKRQQCVPQLRKQRGSANSCCRGLVLFFVFDAVTLTTVSLNEDYPNALYPGNHVLFFRKKAAEEEPSAA